MPPLLLRLLMNKGEIMNRLFPWLRKGVLASMLISGMMGAALASPLDGGISLSRTRVIFLSTDSAQSITIKNQGKSPYLVESAVMTSPEALGNPPFMSTPPLFRLEANSQNALRIVRKGNSALPNDRESLFYFMTNAIAASKKPEESHPASMSARISIGVKNTIKLFYRPVGLSMTSEQAAGKLSFRQQGNQLQVSNPTPYYLTFAQLTLDGTVVNVRESVSMIPPFAHAAYTVKGKVRQAQWSVITDYGGNSKTYHAAVQQG